MSGMIMSKRVVTATNALTMLLAIKTASFKTLNLQMTVADFALAEFEVVGRVHVDAPYADIATTAASFDAATMSYPMLAASGDLTTQAAGDGAFILNCDGYRDIAIKAKSSNVAGSEISFYYSMIK